MLLLENYIMTSKGLITTVQEYKGKFTIPIPMGLINLLGINKKDTLVWHLDNGRITIKIVKARFNIAPVV